MVGLARMSCSRVAVSADGPCKSIPRGCCERVRVRGCTDRGGVVIYGPERVGGVQLDKVRSRGRGSDTSLSHVMSRPFCSQTPNPP